MRARFVFKTNLRKRRNLEGISGSIGTVSRPFLLEKMEDDSGVAANEALLVKEVISDVNFVEMPSSNLPILPADQAGPEEESPAYQRFKFNTREQKPGENFQAFASALRLLSDKCDYDADENLVATLVTDRFIAGVRGGWIVQSELIKAARSNFVLDDLVRLAGQIEIPRLRRAKKLKKAEYACTQCQSTFSNKKVFLKHLRDDHGVLEVHTCPDCGQEFTDKLKFGKHKFTHQTEFVCKLCNSGYKSQSCLKSHVRLKHENEGGKVCLICFQKVEDEAALQEHTATAHNDCGLLCTVCSKQLRPDESLRSHIKKKHSVDGKTVCPFCGKMFALLEQHIAKEHNEEQEETVKCPECDFTGTRHNLQCHTYYHHPKGPH